MLDSENQPITALSLCNLGLQTVRGQRWRRSPVVYFCADLPYFALAKAADRAAKDDWQLIWVQRPKKLHSYGTCAVVLRHTARQTVQMQIKYIQVHSSKIRCVFKFRLLWPKILVVKCDPHALKQYGSMNYSMRVESNSMQLFCHCLAHLRQWNWPLQTFQTLQQISF